ncbi:MAG: ATP phosphoribosyltransferase [Thermomicrobiales bacterium]
MSQDSTLRIALSSKGTYQEESDRFLSSAGLSVWRPNPRQYIGRIPTVPGSEVLFQRPEDIVHKVADGSVDLGITGYDLVAEHGYDEPNIHVTILDLGFRRCELVLAIPDYWLDVQTIDDLAELSIAFKRDGRDLRVATKFPNLTTEFLYRHGVNYFSLVGATGAIEAAPALGYADVVVDLSQTGVTLRDNHLRIVDGGTLLKAQACLIASKSTVGTSPERLDCARTFIEYCEAKRAARRYRVVTANVPGESPEDVARHVVSNLDLAGERGPTIAPVHAKTASDKGWFSVTVIVSESHMLDAVDHLRSVGSTGITVSTPDYMFGAESNAFAKLKDEICREAGHPYAN